MVVLKILSTVLVQWLEKMKTNLTGGHLDRQLDVTCFDDMFGLAVNSQCFA